MAVAAPSEVPPTTENIPEVKQIAVAAGYGDSVAHALYALCTDGTVWVRGVRSDSPGWQPILLAKAPVTLEGLAL